MKSIVTNEDNMEMIKRHPDGFFDLAIVDPPYGIGMDWKKSKRSRHFNLKSGYNNATIPCEEYFNELFRVSKNQIIWGYNYYAHLLPITNNIIVWDKVLEYEKGLKSEGELAFSSFKRYPLLIYRHQWDGFKKGTENGKVNTIHPHQKPVHLYRWILKKFCTAGDKILDTHLGSQSSRIAADIEGFDFWGCEIDEKHFTDGCNRYNTHKKQLILF